MLQVGWGATAGFSEGWAWDQAAATYTLDPVMSKKLRDANPQVCRSVTKCFERWLKVKMLVFSDPQVGPTTQTPRCAFFF